MNSSPAIVIDNGAYKLKAGFAGRFEPNYKINPEINVPSENERLYNNNYESKKVFISEDDWDWKGVEELYRHLLYDKLHLNEDTKYNFLLTQHPFTHNLMQKKLTEMIFEKFNGGGIYFGMTTSLSLYANGLTTGCIIDSGYKNTYITPVFEGYMFSLFSKKLNFGGLTLDYFLIDLLKAKSKNITLKDAEIIKKRFSYAALDFTDEETRITQQLSLTKLMYKLNDDNMNKVNIKGTINCLLPDGTKLKSIDINAERFQSVELMFQPQLYNKLNKTEKSVPETIHQSISKCEYTLHRELFKSIVLSGGNTLISGLKERIIKDVSQLAPASNTINIYSSPQRAYSSWSGGSLLAEQEEMQNVWITADLYDEIGVQSLLLRCF